MNVFLAINPIWVPVEPKGILHTKFHSAKCGTRWLKWLEREFTDHNVRRSNPTSASRLALSRLGQPGSIPALVIPSGGMASRHRKVVTAERPF
ncbi:hypothetical protein CSKR_102983 [Clonorchis sinensis]|uniref:Uncharacterized protein n=1 Tax=Clonorchis sinensis TaxID=79923 RepID=A0A3R7JNF5_CLOSI|nr:hypothetical protein CSKR_102983 [Clonorchis sinensis]